MIAILSAVLAACAVQNIRQLDRYKGWAGQGDDASIAADGYYGATARLAEATQLLSTGGGNDRACALTDEARSLLTSARSRSGTLAPNIEQTQRQVVSSQAAECAS